jgi:hypothetical protein
MCERLVARVADPLMLSSAKDSKCMRHFYVSRFILIDDISEYARMNGRRLGAVVMIADYELVVKVEATN